MPSYLIENSFFFHILNWIEFSAVLTWVTCVLMKKRFHTEQRVFIQRGTQAKTMRVGERPKAVCCIAYLHYSLYTVRNMARDAFARKKPIFWSGLALPPLSFHIMQTLTWWFIWHDLRQRSLHSQRSLYCVVQIYCFITQSIEFFCTHTSLHS